MASNKMSTRRAFLAHAAGCAAAATLGTVQPSRRAHAQDRPPNVVFIICDQMRGDALSCLGSPNARTPNLDRMAAQGVRCERAFSNNPVCVPSRVSAFSGRYPHEHGNLTNDSGERLASLEGTMLGHFRERGYRLGWFGKNHTYTNRPLRTLDAYSERSREPFRKYTPEVPPWWHGDSQWPAERCHASLTTAESIDFINGSKNEPFFMHVSYFDPHPPYFAPAAFTSKYGSKDMHTPDYVAPEKLGPRLAAQKRAMQFELMGEDGLSEAMRCYYASIEYGVDLQVGRLLDALETAGLSENTVVLFTSDHGDFMGQHGMLRKGMFLYDALLHVPMIWHAPGRIAKGHRTASLVETVDLFPTLMELTGARPETGLPGQSVAPLLRDAGTAAADRTIYASAAYNDFPEDYFDDPPSLLKPDEQIPLHTRVLKHACEAKYRTVMARNQEWKIILNESGGPELYCMAGGTVERENVADKTEHREIRRGLEAEAERLWAW